MRIGFQIEHFDAARGGAETYVVRLARRLAAEGHEVHVFCASAAELIRGVEVHAIGAFRPETTRAAVASAGLDVVVGTGKCLGMNLFQPHGGTVVGTLRQNVALVRNPLLRKLAAIVKRLSLKRRRALDLERRQFGQTNPAPHVVAVSKMVAEDIRRHYAVPDDRLHVVYNGADTEAFSPRRCSALRDEARRAWGLSPTTVCFLLAAHNFRLKGVRELIEAAAVLRRTRADFRVVIVGRGGRWGPAFRAWRLGCGDVVRFAGPTADMAAAYAAADVYVHPTWYDPCSLAVLEAWACGLPVITTRFNGASELMTHGREGFLIDTPANAASLAARMADLMDPALRARMGQAARALAERHTEQDNLREMMAVFRLAAANRVQ